MIIREEIEAAERERLSPKAAFAGATRGRERREPEDMIRTAFQRDRDRIIHTKAFRRLTHKTQVFLAPEGDHYRTRLTHTLEVSQVSRAVARALRLNEDLTEAISLGHDLGHTPFGHIGEEALTQCLQDEDRGQLGRPARSFRHNEQSLRVVDVLENDGEGLNLTWEVRNGILTHTGDEHPATLEGQIVRIADRIAYVSHDIDDALRAGVLTESSMPAGPLDMLGRSQSERVDMMIDDLVTSSTKDTIGLSAAVQSALDELRDFLFAAVYLNVDAKTEDRKAKEIIKMLFAYYMDHPGALPNEFTPVTDEDRIQTICDYIAGMTDRFALRTFEDIYVPQRWMI